MEPHAYFWLKTICLEVTFLCLDPLKIIESLVLFLVLIFAWFYSELLSSWILAIRCRQSILLLLAFLFWSKTNTGGSRCLSMALGWGP